LDQERNLANVNILLATRNRQKLRELAACLAGMEADLITLDETANAPRVEEDGETFQENAIKKATEVAREVGMLTVADDSGLVVDALGGAPGVRSSRYAGEDATDKENNEKLLREMAGVPEELRQARFVCAAAVADPGGWVGVVEGGCEGSIALEERGEHGFGYDPLFIKAGYNKTFAELAPDIKNRISHRFQAMQKAAIMIESYLARKRRPEKGRSA
jgi:XTP/dITP diphosphohydrolase